MLYKIGESPEEIFSTLKHELHRAALDKKHPFRFVVLSTSNFHGPDSRYVVIRAVNEHLHFFVFTDFRTEKVKAIQTHPMSSLLFYHPQKRAQVRIQAKTVIHHQDDLAQQYWKRVQGEARKAYHSILPPGTPIHRPDEAFSWKDTLEDASFFTVLELIPSSIELLQLNGLEHLRIRFNCSNNEWTGQWLAP